MNQTAVADYVKGKLGAIEGIKGTTPGRPESMPALASEYPLNYYEVGEPAGVQLTFGWRSDAYDITITHVLGPPTMLTGEAQLEKTKWADRYRAAFTTDYTLGGNCRDSMFKEGSNNLNTFDATEDYPALEYKLLVVEDTLDSSSSSE